MNMSSSISRYIMEKSVPSLSSIFVSLLKNITGTCFFPYRLHFKETYLTTWFKISIHLILSRGFSGGSMVKNLPAMIPGLGRSPGEGNGNSLQCSCLENPMDRGAWPATVHGVAKEPVRYYLVSKQNSQAVPHVLFSLIIDLTPC